MQEVARGLQFIEPPIFERGSPGRHGASLAPLDVPEVDPAKALGAFARKEAAGLPEVSEPEVVRHFVRLSQQNFAIDTQFYPLGSCTMKFNPKVNEWAARLPGFARLHPYAADDMMQGALELMARLENALAEVVGLDHVCLQPAAGAQGELTGLMMIRAYHQEQGRSPKRVLIPDTAHGTNPASCTLNGMVAVPFPGGPDGIVHPEQIANLLDDDTAAIMMTNPNTLGLFEKHLPTIAKMVHEKGGLVYGDGANLNALMGRARPGDLGVDVMQFNLHKTFTTPHGGGGPGCGPVAFKKILEPYQPKPTVRFADGRYSLDRDRPKSVGRVRSFIGNFGMMVRAYTYIREMGPEGLKAATDLAVLNANYVRARIGEWYPAAYDTTCMHEVIVSDKRLQKETGIKTLDVAKRLIDYGHHPPTVYFPLVVAGAMMIEPTETESKETIDLFLEAMQAIAREAKEQPELLQNAPSVTRLGRLDEARAARKPVLRWKGKGAE
ncbi:MAG TPA: aminomethyl-transferring glycine dehydrogenase subunit GcvPB [Polyangiaceae bacterium]|jgi:glycine dehydrogenase subunit 2